MYQSIFEKIKAHKDEPTIEVLNELVDIIRSKKSAYEGIDSPIESLIYYLTINPNPATDLKVYLINFISQYKQVDVFSHTGMVSGRNFSTLLRERIGERFLPSAADKEQLSYVLTQVFDSAEDVKWLESISPKQWLRLFEALKNIHLENGKTSEKLKQIQYRILHAVELVSYQIAGLSLNDEMSKVYPEIIELNSPFLAQNQEISQYIKRYQERLLSDDEELTPEEDHILVMVDQCQELIKKIHKNTQHSGVSVHLTNLLFRLEQKLERLQNLLSLLHTDTAQRAQAVGQLMYDITYHHHHRTSIRSLISVNTELLSLKITENASKAGESYVSRDFSGYRKMFFAAAGSGLLIGIMATIKVLLADISLPPVGKAFVYSLNYSVGFVLMYFFHFKIATKQPAMTASALAASLEPPSKDKQPKLEELSQLIIDILRTQFIAILGNIALAMPIAFLCCYLWATHMTTPLMTPDKADALLHGIDPFHSLSMFYAFLTGVYLFLSGLISGYYNNRAIYRDLAQRIGNHRLLNRILSKSAAVRIGQYIERNIGSIAGYFWFGVMLGTTSTIGYIVGLPLDIRHIAFSAANMIQGLFWTQGEFDYWTIAYLFMGVVIIGMINLAVSFSLALMVALKARKVRFSQWKALMALVGFRFLTRPHEFFIPVRRTVKETSESVLH